LTVEIYAETSAIVYQLGECAPSFPLCAPPELVFF